MSFATSLLYHIKDDATTPLSAGGEIRESAPCRETPRTGRSEGWRAKAKKEKIRLRKRRERTRKGHPQDDDAPRPSFHHPSNCPPPLPSLYEKTRECALSGSSETVAFFLHRASVPVERGGRSGATASPFRRNGIAVPARRGGRSGETASPFRRNGVAVPARRHPTSRTRRQDGGARRRRARPGGMKKLGNERNHARPCRNQERETSRRVSESSSDRGASGRLDAGVI